MRERQNKKELIRLFAECPVHVDEEQKRRAFVLFAEEIAGKKIVPQMTFPELLRSQASFIEWKVLLLHLPGILLFWMAYAGPDPWWGSVNLYVFPCIASALSGMALAIACNREDAAGIAELAASCYFNHRQLCALHLILYGGIELVLLAASAVLIQGKTKTGLAAAGLYLMVPYLLTGCAEFLILLTGFGRRSNAALFAGGLVMVLLNGSIASIPEWYEPAALWIWVMAFVICAAVYAVEITALLGRMRYAARWA